MFARGPVFAFDARFHLVLEPLARLRFQFFVPVEILLGFDALDYWNQAYNRRSVENEVKKLDAKGKRELAEQLLEQAGQDEANVPATKA